MGMTLIACKNCGDNIAVEEGKTYAVCESCGSTMTLPKIADSQTAAHFNRGNEFRRRGDFDKALEIYEQLVAEDDTNAEAHWCCALSRFGIEYVLDNEETMEYLPTCHRMSLDSFLEDVDYQAALKYADVVAKRQYQRDAAKIAEVQRGILATSQDEEPFDVFICYKEKDATGHRTPESHWAQQIYYELTNEQGYRVFFSRITLDEKGGTQFEPYIFAALNSAKVMLVVTSRREYLESVWVKNEWSRYLKLMKKDRKKLLVPCYGQMQPEELPDALSGFQSYNVQEIGFVNELTRRLKKVLDAEQPAPKVIVQQVAQPAPQPAPRPVAQGPVYSVDALLKRGNMALEDRDWNKAQDFFDKVLNMDAECSEAYLGKALIDFRVTNLAQLESSLQLRKDNSSVEHRQAGRADAAEERRFVEEYLLPGYLDEAKIRELLYFNFSYTRDITGWEKVKTEADNKLKNNRNFSRAITYGNAEQKARLNKARDGVRSFYDSQIASSKAAEETKVRRMKDDYASHLRLAEEKLRPMHERALSNRDSEYNAAVNQLGRLSESSTLDQARNVYNLFTKRGLAGYKDSDSYARKCSELMEAIRKENDRRAELQRRKRAELKKKEEAKARATKVAIAVGVIVAVMALIAGIVALYNSVIYPNLIMPNQENPDRHTPEILKTYSGTYATSRVKGTAIVTLTECDQNGNLKGTFEFSIDEVYGKYALTGTITSKKNNGNIKLTLTAGEWILQPEGYIPLEEMEVSITDDYQTFFCSKYDMNWKSGGTNENAIASAEDLSKLSGAGGTFVLSGDIDLAGVSFAPIEGFTGTLLGNGYTIKNMTIESSDSNVGFFATLEGTVMNLSFENANVTVTGKQESVGILCGTLKGTAISVTTAGTVTAPESTHVGGAVGLWEPKVENAGTGYSVTELKNHATVSGKDGTGGVIGTAMYNGNRETNILLSGLVNSGAVTGEENVGGIVGMVYAEATNIASTAQVELADLENTGSVAGKLYVGGLVGYGCTDHDNSWIHESVSKAPVSGEAAVGGIAGYLAGMGMTSCGNEGATVTATGYLIVENEKCAYVGGLAGRGTWAQDCTNSVDINYTGGGMYTGGIIGYSDARCSTTYNKVTMNDLVNTGNIAGGDCTGGIIGYLNEVRNQDCELVLQQLTNNGTVTGGSYVGGILGKMKAEATNIASEVVVNMIDLQNTGNISGKSYVGGLLGYGFSDSKDSMLMDPESTGTVTGSSYRGDLAGALEGIQIK